MHSPEADSTTLLEGTGDIPEVDDAVVIEEIARISQAVHDIDALRTQNPDAFMALYNELDGGARRPSLDPQMLTNRHPTDFRGRHVVNRW